MRLGGVTLDGLYANAQDLLCQWVGLIGDDNQARGLYRLRDMLEYLHIVDSPFNRESVILKST